MYYTLWKKVTLDCEHFTIVYNGLKCFLKICFVKLHKIMCCWIKQNTPFLIVRHLSFNGSQWIISHVETNISLHTSLSKLYFIMFCFYFLIRIDFNMSLWIKEKKNWDLKHIAFIQWSILQKYFFLLVTVSREKNYMTTTKNWIITNSWLSRYWLIRRTLGQEG